SRAGCYSIPQRTRTARGAASFPSSRMKWHINGSAISSPWRGGTISGLTKAAEQFYPQWQSWLNGYGAKQFAMALDARRTSHPIQQPIANESEAMIAF